MLRSSVSRVTAVLLTLFVGMIVVPTAQAAGSGQCAGSLFGAACSFSASSTTTTSGGTATGANTSVSDMKCMAGGKEIPCSSDGASWSSARMCYVKAVDPTSSVEAGVAMVGIEKKEGDSVFMSCTSLMGVTSYYWAASAPEAGPDPAVVAQQAITSMGLRMGTLASNPPESSDPSVMGLVGYPVWLWISDPSESTTGPITREATSGSVTVSATATLASIVWDMGDGTSVTCNGGGTAYVAADGRSESPTCGHIYQQTSVDQPGQEYPVTATATWDITWSGGGQSGSQTVTFSDSTKLRIGEAQVLLTGTGS